MTENSPLSERLRERADATTGSVYNELTPDLEAAEQRVDIGAGNPDKIIGPLVNVLLVRSQNIVSAMKHFNIPYASIS